MGFTLTHELEHAVHIAYDRMEIARYVYRPRVDSRESPKPYFHPVKTLLGDPVTLYRPIDHPWHQGIAFSFAEVSGENFWGGATYVNGQGYKVLDNFGYQRHVTFEEMYAIESGAGFTEYLDWIAHTGDSWVSERRQVDLSLADSKENCWRLTFRTSLRNVTGENLEFGSPTTQGRPNAGYGGLFWRGPRSFLNGDVITEGGNAGPDAMGTRSSWLSYTGQHDGSCNTSSVVFADSPENPRHPTKWFVRTDPFACASFAFTFDQVYKLPPDESVSLEYSVIISAAALSRERIEELL